MLHIDPPQFDETTIEPSNDFFFGYLQLKWRRLFRVLCLVAIGILPLIFLELSNNWFDELEGFLSYFMFLGLVIFLIGLISWVLKPFIVNREKESEIRFRKSLKPGLNEDEIDEMRDFKKRADYYLEKIKEKRFKNLKKKKKFTLADIIETARGMEISDAAIKLYLRKRGFKEADINEAMKILKK